MCVPREGVIDGEGSGEVRVFFNPDHQSASYTDKLLVEFNEKVSGVRIEVFTHVAFTGRKHYPAHDC